MTKRKAVVFMAEERRSEIPYAPRDVLGMYLQHLTDKRELERKIDALDSKLDRNTTRLEVKIDILDKKIDNVDARLNVKIDSVEAKLTDKIDGVEAKLTDKINSVEERLNAKIDAVDDKLSARIDGVKDELSAKIDGVDKRLDDMDKTNNKWMAFIAILVTVVAPIITIIVQRFIQ